MTEQQAHQLLAQAERAATAGDLAAADELLRGAARLQEEELGPLHPDLANTLNNLAIITERNGSASEAETLYRRAASIAAAALPSDDPMVIESRQNLEDFCRARGLPVDPPPVVAPAAVVAPPAVVAPAVVTPPAAVAPPASRRGAWLATAAIVLVAVLLLLWRPWSSREAPATTPVPAPEPVAAAPVPETIAIPPKAAAPVPPREDRPVATNKPPKPGEVTVATAQLCRTFSTSGASWRCDAAGQSVTAGSVTFYTRVRSPRETTVIHRWVQGATLRQSVMLKVQANTTEGYRTYSRLTLDPGNWRMEVRTEDGSLLHEQRLTVR